MRSYDITELIDFEQQPDASLLPIPKRAESPEESARRLYLEILKLYQDDPI